MNLRRSTLPIVVLVAAAAATTACASVQKTAAGAGAVIGSGPGGGTAKTGATTQTPDAGASSALPAKPSAQASASHSAASGPAKPAPSGPAKGAVSSADPNATSDSYAWKHPCGSDQVTVKVGPGPDGAGPDIRIVTVTNTSPKACGLSYFPSVLISDSSSVGGNGYPARFVQPKPPEGLGGMPYIPIYAGQSQYAAISLNPSGASAGASHAYDEIDAQASDFLPHAATADFPAHGADGKNPAVLNPAISLFERTTAEAIRGLPRR